ncbi:MAG: type I-U CRISPR-associated helicase/endonuclease Cas3 [Gemmataceae bacterium]
MADSPFEKCFEILTGNRPFPWQTALFERFLRGDFPASANLATGLGKTLVLAIWLIARHERPELVPRRLVYVVNRRTVVDQTTTEAENLRRNAGKAGVTAPAISTLRGQFADNREWSADPSRPAIIVGTVDMIGSRLLFSGYGVGFKARPLHAGFLGQDVLLVHDEAHLEPAFQQLIVRIAEEQARCNEFRRLRVMELTATSRGTEAFPNAEERQKNEAHEIVKKRIGAKKSVHLHPIDDEKKQLTDAVVELARKHEGAPLAVLVFVRTVEHVEQIVKKLPAQRTRQLTGTLRGLERDRLVDDPLFRRFLPRAQPGAETVYLVCTSAGEVGVNLSADHLVCDLSTFESMAQRFGRVNRFGTCQDTRIDIVHPSEFESNELEQRQQRTLALLRELHGDGSPGALGRLDVEERQKAFAPAPVILPVSDMLFDAWALTSIRDRLPGRPLVEPYLHGVSAWQPPETRVAWRAEVEQITGALLNRYRPEDLLADYPLKPHELLRDRSDRVFKHLAKLAERSPIAPVWLVDESGSVQVLTMQALTDKEQIQHRTVLLSPAVGGLGEGLLNGEAPSADSLDVADLWLDESNQPRRRRSCWSDEPPPDAEEREQTRGMRLVIQIDTRSEADEEDSADAESPTSRPAQRYWRWYVRPWSADDDLSRTTGRPVALDVHTKDVVNQLREILGELPLEHAMKQALLVAAEWHDSGKRRAIFQAVLGNTDRTRPLAKSDGRTYEVSDYRHEFGSLVDLMHPSQAGWVQPLDEELRELVLHLIAAHHGYGRPHFPADRAFDPEALSEVVQQITREVPQRFGRLQRRYGRWGLAYLESLLRAADYAASAEPSEFVEGER